MSDTEFQTMFWVFIFLGKLVVFYFLMKGLYKAFGFNQQNYTWKGGGHGKQMRKRPSVCGRRS